MAGNKIGDNPLDITLPDVEGTDHTLSTEYNNIGNGKVILLSFIEYDTFDPANTQYGWMEHLVYIQNAIDTKVQVIAVFFHQSGSVDPVNLSGRIDYYNTNNTDYQINFPILVDKTWITVTATTTLDDCCYAQIYQHGFYSGTLGNCLDPYNDPDFTGTMSNELWSYIIWNGQNINWADFKIMDKWHELCTDAATDNPISFKRLRLRDSSNDIIKAIDETNTVDDPGNGIKTGVIDSDPFYIVADAVSFDSEAFYNTQAFVIERIGNIVVDPRILYANPEIGSSIETLTSADIIFSKPLNDGPAGTPTNFPVQSGNGVTNPGSTDSAIYTGVNKIENFVSLGFSGVVLTDSNPDDTVRINVNNIVDTAGNSLTGDNYIDYTAVIPNTDIYIRDNTNDVGTTTSTGVACLSPDIMLRDTEYNPPDSDPTLLSDDEGPTTEFTLGNTYYIYLRIRNCGAIDLTYDDLKGSVYWAVPSTNLINYNLWNKINTAPITFYHDLDSGSAVSVSNAIPLDVTSANGFVEGGHYCFIAIVGTVDDVDKELNEDDGSLQNALSSVTYFSAFVREYNNVAWRNFDVIASPAPLPPQEEEETPVQQDPDVGGDDPEEKDGKKRLYRLPFFFAGGMDKDEDLPFQLEVVTRLPEGSRSVLVIPISLLEELKKTTPGLKIKSVDSKRKLALVHVNPYKQYMFGEVHLPPKTRYKMWLVIYIPLKHRKKNYEVFVQQLYRGEQIGRVTWALGPQRIRKKPCFIMRFFRFLFRILFKRTRKRVVKETA